MTDKKKKTQPSRNGLKRKQQRCNNNLMSNEACANTPVVRYAAQKPFDMQSLKKKSHLAKPCSTLFLN